MVLRLNLGYYAPRVVQIQVVIVPCGITGKSNEAIREKVFEAAKKLATELKKQGIRSKADLRENQTPGFKFNHWELRV